MMNTTRSALLFAVITAACSTVAETDPGPDAGTPDEPDAPTPPVFAANAPTAATSPSSLFNVSFSTASYIRDVVVPTGRYDVVEQVVSMTTDEPQEVTFDLFPPTGTYARTIASATTQETQIQALDVLCESNGIATFDPRCETTEPSRQATPKTGMITAATWQLRLVDDVTGSTLASCHSPFSTRLVCQLPGKVASYTLVGSAGGFADLWDATKGTIGEHTLWSLPFTGSIAAQHEYQCVGWRETSSSVYCTHRFDHTRFHAIDKARLSFDPIEIRISAGTDEVTMASPAMTWDAGDDDLPGYY